MIHKKIVFGFFLLYLFFLSAQTISACSCLEKPTVLDSFEGSEIVVATRLVSVEKVGEKNSDYDINYITSAKMVVEKVYKGKVKVGDELTFAQGGGADCVWTFDEEWIGSKYLFYLDAPSKGHPFLKEDKDAEPMYYAITCGRSTTLAAAVEDLNYLNNIEKLRGKTRVSGKLDSWYTDSPVFADRKIRIIGKDKIYRTKTDKKGFYEIYGLPPGDYLVEPETIKGWKVNSRMLEYSSRYIYDPDRFDPKKNQFPLVLEKGRHANLDLLFIYDNEIRGRIISPTGEPMKNVCVKAVATDLKEGDYRGQSNCTNENGEYVIDELSPDNYILVINDDGKMDGDEPFGVMFYPGVSEFKNAGVVSIGNGTILNGINIQITKVAELITVSGTFLYADGSPVSDDWVDFSPKSALQFDSSRTKTDQNGKFTLKIPKGANGKLFGGKSIYKSDIENCPEALKILIQEGKSYSDVKTNEIEIEADENLSDLKLVLPIPKCEKID